MSNLSELLPTGGGQNTANFVASGTLSSGQVVVLRSDGTVEAVSASPATGGANNTFDTSYPYLTSGVYDESSNTIVLAYRQLSGSAFGRAVVGSISGTTITFGTAVVFESATIGGTKIAYGNGKVVITYSDSGNSDYGTAIVGTVSGTSISFGTAAIFASHGLGDASPIVYDSINDKFIIAYLGAPSTYYGYTRFATVSGTSISFSGATIFAFVFVYRMGMVYDPDSGNAIVAYRDVTSGNLGRVQALYINGSSMSYGSVNTFYAGGIDATTEGLGVVYDTTNDKVVISFKVSNLGRVIVGSVSGTSFSFGTLATYTSSGNLGTSSLCFDSSRSVVLIQFADPSNSGYFTVTEGTVSGTSISLSTPAVVKSVSTSSYLSSYDTTANQAIMGFTDGSNSYGQAFAYIPAGSTKDNAIGLTASAIANGASGSVNLKGGLNEAQTGLTIGADYYAQDDGTLSTTVTSSKIGQAISATTINMMDLT